MNNSVPWLCCTSGISVGGKRQLDTAYGSQPCDAMVIVPLANTESGRAECVLLRHSMLSARGSSLSVGILPGGMLGVVASGSAPTCSVVFDRRGVEWAPARGCWRAYVLGGANSKPR